MDSERGNPDSDDVGRAPLFRDRRDGETSEEYKRSLRENWDVFYKRKVASQCPEEDTKPSRIGASSQSGSLTKESHKIRYKKTSGAATGSGESYEWKTLTLVSLRLLAAGREFQLASNVEAAGKFDDVVMRQRKHSEADWDVSYTQLKHKDNKNKCVKKADLFSLTGDFSLVKYCDSYETMKLSGDRELNSYGDISKHKINIFTNASINDDLVFEVKADPFLRTGGKVVSFKPGGEVYRELCEWVDFKETLTELYRRRYREWQESQEWLEKKDWQEFEDWNEWQDKEVEIRVKDALQSVEYQNKAVSSWKDELLKSPTTGKLKELLKKLASVSDKAAFSSFLAKLQVYTNQAHESELDAKIEEEFARVWIRSHHPDVVVMLNNLKARVKIWWQRENFYLTHDSRLWFEIVKSQAEAMSKSTVERLTRSGVEFVQSSVQALYENMVEIGGGIFNLRVDARTAASSLKVHQALAKFGANEHVLHVNVKALLDREVDLLAAWATRWCRVLAVECDHEMQLKHAVRIGERILNVIGRGNENKLLVLIAAEKHELNVQLYRAESYKRFNDNFVWNELTTKSIENILANIIVINGTQLSQPMADLVGRDKGFVNKADLEVVSQLICGDVICGKNLDDERKFFVNRRLKESADGVPFLVNSVLDVERKVVLVVAEPGMGKSTLVTHLAKSAKTEDPTAWIVHIKLNDCAQYLKDVDMEHFHELAAKKFLEQSALSPGNSLERLLFASLEHKLVVFVDGVDEVCPHYEQQVFTILRFLKDMKFRQLWVASRPVFKTKLEDTLKVKSLHLVAFSKQDQTEFLNKVWKANVQSATSEKCSEATERLLTWLTDSLGKDNPILGVPLMTVMIAEIFQEQIFSRNGANDELLTNERLDVMSLYNNFVKKKFDLYCIEKKKTPNREMAANIDAEATLLKHLHHNHRLAALRLLLSREEIAGLQFEGKETFDKDLTAYLNEVSDGREKTGIIDSVSDGIPHFVHRSFAEFFAASWLASNFQANRKFIKQIIFDTTYKLLCEMFNRYLAQNHALHVAVLSRDLEATKRLLVSQSEPFDVNELDAGGRTPLHLAVFLCATDQHPDCIHITEYLIRGHNAKLDVADEVLRWPPLRYAEWSGAWAALEIILVKRGYVVKGWLNLMKKKDSWSAPDPDPRLMLAAAKDASVLVVRYLVEERGGKLNSQGPQGETMIHRAAEGGNFEMLEFLCTKGLSLNIKDNNGNTAMFYASPQTARYLAERGLNLEAVNKQGLTALQVAAQNGAHDLMAALLELKASFQVSKKPKASQLNTCLLCAAFAGSLESVEKLVKMGASVYHRDNNNHAAAWVAMYREHIEIMNWLLLQGSKKGETALDVACRNGELDIVAFILSHGTRTNKESWERVPLTLAVLNGHSDVMELLLKMGASVDCRDKYGRTLLHSATFEGNKQAMELLLRHGANIDAEDIDGQSLLHAASRNNHSDVIELLLKMGARADCRDKYGRTPLHIASWWGYKKAVVSLLSHGAKVDAEDYVGQSLLHTASRNGHLEVMELLLKMGASVDCQDKYGRTPLHTASWWEMRQAVALLLNHSAKVDAEDYKGWTPLHAASEVGHSGVIELLLAAGANVDCRDKLGWTPLFTATWWGKEQAVELLLHHGAKIDTENNEGQTLLHAATRNNKLDMAKLILEKLDLQLLPGEKLAQSVFGTLMAAAVNSLGSVIFQLDNFDAERECMSKLDYINMADLPGWTAIHFAACLGHTNVVRFLISQGGDPHIHDNHDNTPLHLAAANNHYRVLSVLLEALDKTNRAAAAVNSCDKFGNSVLMCGAWGGGFDCVVLLIKAGGKLMQINNNARTPLIIAASKWNESVVSYLLSAYDHESEGMSKQDYIYMVDEDGNSALDLADTNSRIVIERCLAELND